MYSTKPQLDQSYVPELTALAKKVGVKFSDFTVTDNSCKAEPPLRLAKIADLDTLGDDVRVVEKDIGKEVMSGSRFVGREARLLSKEVGKDVKAAERLLEKDVGAVEKAVEKDVQVLEKRAGKVIVDDARALKDDIRALEVGKIELRGRGREPPERSHACSRSNCLTSFEEHVCFFLFVFFKRFCLFFFLHEYVVQIFFFLFFF